MGHSDCRFSAIPTLLIITFLHNARLPLSSPNSAEAFKSAVVYNLPVVDGYIHQATTSSPLRILHFDVQSTSTPH
ncbi:hypothetical protein BDV98DRAFT_336315 [Pterulicium gracile]|uniref:Uncharacterized protein n=1 Tax=Pterulicium gracile TaxID=1884261 RepID=A0A5C3Q5M6_9AGAR|nr:hypothetical protein BDV98DRAFT_336315 [Pterula gracilis]